MNGRPVKSTVAQWSEPRRVTVNFKGTNFDLIRVGFQQRDDAGRPFWPVFAVRPAGRKIHAGRITGWTVAGGLIIWMNSRPITPSESWAMDDDTRPHAHLRASEVYAETKTLWMSGAVKNARL